MAVLLVGAPAFRTQSPCSQAYEIYYFITFRSPINNSERYLTSQNTRFAAFSGDSSTSGMRHGIT
jgi:hypothetical protein